MSQETTGRAATRLRGKGVKQRALVTSGGPLLLPWPLSPLVRFVFTPASSKPGFFVTENVNWTNSSWL